MESNKGTDCNRQRLSSLMDGALDAAELDAALQEAAALDSARDCWRTYQLIGDVLRSPELALSQRCDAQWLAHLRQRLQTEPVPAAAVVQHGESTRVAQPLTQQPAANDGVFRWKMVAGLASFAAVAALGWNLLGSVQAPPAGAVLAQNETTPTAPVAQVSTMQRQIPTEFWSPAQVPYSVVLRSPELDRLLAQQARANAEPAAATRAGEFLRNAGYAGTER